MATRKVTLLRERHQRATRLLRDRIAAHVQRVWLNQTSWRDADVDRFVALVVPVVEAGKRTVAQLTDNYLRQVEQEVLGTLPKPKAIPDDVLDTRKGITTAESYKRVGVATWAKLAQGATLPVAVTAGAAFARSLVNTDVELAETHTAQYVLSTNDQVVGFRRVPSPDACQFCQDAADQVYGTEDLMPIHADCGCGIEPEYGDGSPNAPAPVEGSELGPVLDQS